MTGLQHRSIEALERDPALPAIEFEGRWHFWGDLRRIAHGVQTALDASGIGPRAPVAFVPRNRPESIAALLALLTQGRTIRMIYAFQSPAGIAASIERTEPAAVIAHADDLGPEVQRILARDSIAAVALDAMEASALAGFERGTEHIASGEPRIEILTSGTTGPPKHFDLLPTA